MLVTCKAKCLILFLEVIVQNILSIYSCNENFILLFNKEL